MGQGSEHHKEPLYYVGIGASAGGLEALDTLFSHMPAESGLAFIVIQHLSPDYKSLMVELLSKRTAMKVVRAEEGLPVEANTVYLIPPRKELTIFHGKLVLSDMSHHNLPNLPIDIFFRSLAVDQAERAVGIVLSGTGSDGVRGIRAIKEQGGMVVVQKESSARFDGMPRAAINTGLADVILTPEEMPEKLMSYISHPMAKLHDSEEDGKPDEDSLARVFSMLRDQSGVDFTYYKPSTVMRRIQRRLTVNQLSSLQEYADYLKSCPGELSTLYRELLIGVTSFFRDKEVFRILSEQWIPELVENADSKDMRFWVPGCSTGEEAYSIAILVQEALRQASKPVNIKIFATDIDREAVIAAGNGLYPESIAADLPQGLLSKYFVRRDGQYRVDRATREMVIFAQHNLIKDPPFTNIDFISCRNLLIYLQPVLQEKVLEHFAFSLRPGGVLLLGTSETLGELAGQFETLSHKSKLFRLRNTRRPKSLSPIQPVQMPAPAYNEGGGRRSGRRLVNARLEERIQERLLQKMASEFSSLAAVVNQDLELVHLAGEAEGYFRPPAGKQVNDITKMAMRELSIPLSTSLQRVFSTGTPVKYSNIRLGVRGKDVMVQLSIHPLDTAPGQLDLAAIFLQEQPNGHDCSDEDMVRFDINQEAEQRIKDLEQELQFKSENLQATVEELETSNEELQATNEELLASNEELQSTNEELQSVNEELHTVNAEYQSKILELTEMTNDLDNLMNATRIATLFLDDNLDVRKFTPEVERVFRLSESDVGSPLTQISHSLETDPYSVVESVLESEEPWENEVRSTEGDWFFMRVLPYRIDASESSGLVVTMVDISRLKRAEGALDESTARIRSLYEAAPVGLGLVEDRTFLDVSSRTCSLLKRGKDELVGESTRVMYASQAEFDRVGEERPRRIKAEGTAMLETVLKRGDGSRFPALVSFAPLDADNSHGPHAVAILDIEARRRREGELQRMTDLLNATQSLTKVGGWEWDVERETMFWTEETYRIHGISSDDVEEGSAEHIEKSLSCYRKEDVATIMEAFRRCVEEGHSYDLQLPFTDFNGRSTCIRTTAAPLRKNGKVTKIIGNIMDLGPLEKETA